jgi:hypothetical protein
MDIAHAKNVKNACAKEPVAVARQRMTLKEIERKAKARTAERNRKRSNDQREREIGVLLQSPVPAPKCRG